MWGEQRSTLSPHTVGLIPKICMSCSKSVSQLGLGSKVLVFCSGRVFSPLCSKSWKKKKNMKKNQQCEMYVFPSRDEEMSVFMHVYSMSVAQSYPTLCDPMDCSPPGSSVHGILQARVLKWVAIPFSRESSQPRDWIQVSCLAGRFFTIWATREAHVYTSVYKKHALKTDKQKVTMVSKQQTRLEASCFLYHLGQKFCFVLLKQN